MKIKIIIIVSLLSLAGTLSVAGQNISGDNHRLKSITFYRGDPSKAGITTGRYDNFKYDESGKVLSYIFVNEEFGSEENIKVDFNYGENEIYVIKTNTQASGGSKKVVYSLRDGLVKKLIREEKGDSCVFDYADGRLTTVKESKSFEETEKKYTWSGGNPTVSLEVTTFRGSQFPMVKSSIYSYTGQKLKVWTDVKTGGGRLFEHCDPILVNEGYFGDLPSNEISIDQLDNAKITKKTIYEYEYDEEGYPIRIVCHDEELGFVYTTVVEYD